MLLSSANGHTKWNSRMNCSGKLMNRYLALFLSASILHGFAPAAFGAGLDLVAFALTVVALGGVSTALQGNQRRWMASVS